jgi:2-dehydropantoate 2-reductase
LVMAGITHTSMVKASDRATQLGVQDLVVLAVKGAALLSVAPTIGPLLGPNTTVLSAMNGIPWWFFHGLAGPMMNTSLRTVDADGTVSGVLPPAHVLGCVVYAACSTAEPGCSIHKSGNELVIGEPRGGTSTRLGALAAVLRKADFDVTVSQRIQQDIWYKLWGNMTMNPISALTGATCDRILDDPLVNAFVLRVMAEAAEIGARIGCTIAESGEDRNAVTRKHGAFKTSMLQDVEAGRALEIDALLAAPREIGRKLAVATPNMDTLHGLTRLFAAVRGLNPPVPLQP